MNQTKIFTSFFLALCTSSGCQLVTDFSHDRTVSTAGEGGDDGSSGGSVSEATDRTPTKGGSSAKGGTSSRDTIGGTTAIGGSSNSGGTTAIGGSSNSGGTTAIGGSSNSGGTTAIGGSSNSGGTTVASQACDLAKTFASPFQVVPLSSSSDNVSGISVSANGLSAIVSIQDNTTSAYDLKLYTRSSTASPFGNATTFPGAGNINTSAQESGPRLSRDGLMLFYVRGSSGGSRIFLSTRATVSENFPEGTMLETATVNSDSFALSPWVSKDNTYIYWSLGDATRSVYSAQIATSGFVNKALVTSMSQAGNPVLTDDLLTMYFSSDGPDVGSTTNTNVRIWKMTRSTTLASWSMPTIVSELNDSRITYSFDVSPDGCILYYSKDGLIYQAVKPL